MSKELFLKELQARIRILEDSEQQDILAEYAQHIDLQMSGGLSEEEAIRDFGSLDELAAQILEAYHVKPGCVKKPALSVRIPALKVPDPRPALRKAEALLNRGAAAFMDFLWRLGGGIKRFFLSIGQRLGAALQHIPHVKRVKREKREVPQMKDRHPLRALGAALKTAGRQLGYALGALLRLLCNLALLFAAIPFAVLGGTALLCTGTLMVLLAQGYPFVGLLLCCVGAVLCCVAVLILGAGLLRWKKPVAADLPPADSGPVLPPSEGSAELEVHHA